MLFTRYQQCTGQRRLTGELRRACHCVSVDVCVWHSVCLWMCECLGVCECGSAGSPCQGGISGRDAKLRSYLGMLGGCVPLRDTAVIGFVGLAEGKAGCRPRPRTLTLCWKPGDLGLASGCADLREPHGLEAGGASGGGVRKTRPEEASP